jgi:Tol biopolymer transport system component
VAKADGSDEHPLLPAPQFDYNASFSADGHWVTFTSERNGSADIYRVHPDGTGLERLTDDLAYDDQSSLSPDSSRLAFVSSRGSGRAAIWVLDLKTRKAHRLTNSSGGEFRPSWSPDGKWIAFSSDRGTPIQRTEGAWEHLQSARLYLVEANGSGLRRLTPTGKFAGSPQWSPDSKRIVFYELDVKNTYYARRLGRGVPVESQIISVDMLTGIRKAHTSGPGLKLSPQFLSEARIGYLIKGPSRSGLAFTTGESGATGHMRSPSWSSDGKWVVYHKWSSESRQQNQPLFSMDPEFDLAFSDPFPAFSCDGKRLAVSNRGMGPGEIPSISVMERDGSNARRIFHEADGQALMPQWSPKNDWIAFGAGAYFSGRAKKPARLVMVRPDGSDLHDLTTGPANTGFPSWSPDGKRIVCRVWGESERGLRIITLEDGSSRTLTTGYDNFPAWSPTEDLIAFTRFSDGDFGIYTVRPDGSNLRRLTTTPGTDAHCVWSPDGKHLLFSSSRFGFKDEAPLSDDIPQPYGELLVMNADGSGQRPLTDNQWEDATPAWEPPQRSR